MRSAAVLTNETCTQGCAFCDARRPVEQPALVHPREVFSPAVREGACAIVVAHNHPSGDPAPSHADQRITQSLREAARLLQINLVDHIILGSPDGGRVPYYSFKEAGFL